MTRTVAVSGGFDPVHVGHIRLFKSARALGDSLIVILNNDNWLLAKKGFVFMAEEERKEVLEALSTVDKVVISSHEANAEDMSVADDLAQLRPDVFANGGDRHEDDDDIPPREYTTCEELGIELVFNVGEGGKIQSSSALVEKAEKKK